jgi:transmembrane sensor
MTIKSQDTASDSDRFEIASDWLLRIQAGSLNSEDLAQWLQWYDADSANRAAFEKVQATFDSIRALPVGERSAWASRLDDLQQSETQHIRESTRNHLFRLGNRSISLLVPLPWFSRRVWAPVFTLILAFILGIVLWQIRGDGSIETSAFKTERATHRDISLPDGSRIRLGAKSQLFVNFTSQTRYLVLEGGEAFFEVTKDLERPFLVQAGEVTIRAVGTEFNVRLVMDQTIVAVTEGAVDVVQSLRADDRQPRQAATRDTTEAIRLVAGEQVSIGPTADTVSVKQVESKAVNGWREGRLEFVDEPLGMVIGTINRYSHREVVITDKAVNELRFTGTVSQEHIDEWLSALSEIFPVDVHHVGNETVLISQRAIPSRQNFRFAPSVR